MKKILLKDTISWGCNYEDAATVIGVARGGLSHCMWSDLTLAFADFYLKKFSKVRAFSLVFGVTMAPTIAAPSVGALSCSPTVIS